MAQNARKCRFRVIYENTSWKKTLRLKNDDFDKVYHDLCSYVSTRSKLTFGTQCHITINSNIIYSSDDLQLELEKANGNSVDVIVNVCSIVCVVCGNGVMMKLDTYK